MLETVNNFLPLERKIESRNEREKDDFPCHKLLCFKIFSCFQFSINANEFVKKWNYIHFYFLSMLWRLKKNKHYYCFKLIIIEFVLKCIQSFDKYVLSA